MIYNYSNSQQTWGAAGPGLRIAHCYFKLGPDRRKRPIPVRDNVTAIKGCVSKLRDGKAGPEVADLGEIGNLNLRSLETADQAFKSVLLGAGALPHDATSARMVRETRNGTGRQGYQADIDADRASLKSRPAPQDSDNDGLPDKWETKHGTDPRNPVDSTRVTKSGYTWLELYCHACADRLIRPVSQ